MEILYIVIILIVVASIIMLGLQKRSFNHVVNEYKKIDMKSNCYSYDALLSQLDGDNKCLMVGIKINNKALDLKQIKAKILSYLNNCFISYIENNTFILIIDENLKNNYQDVLIKLANDLSNNLKINTNICYDILKKDKNSLDLLLFSLNYIQGVGLIDVKSRELFNMIYDVKNIPDTIKKYIEISYLARVCDDNTIDSYELAFKIKINNSYLLVDKYLNEFNKFDISKIIDLYLLEEACKYIASNKVFVAVKLISNCDVNKHISKFDIDKNMLIIQTHNNKNTSSQVEIIDFNGDLSSNLTDAKYISLSKNMISLYDESNELVICIIDSLLALNKKIIIKENNKIRCIIKTNNEDKIESSIMAREEEKANENIIEPKLYSDDNYDADSDDVSDIEDEKNNHQIKLDDSEVELSKKEILSEEEIKKLIIKGTKRSFLERISLLDSDTKDYYIKLKNKLLSYPNIKSKMSFSFDSFLLKNNVILRIQIRGKHIRLYYALNPADYDIKTMKDLSNVNRYKTTPLMLKITSNLAFKRAMRLIEDLVNIEKQ